MNCHGRAPAAGAAALRGFRVKFHACAAAGHTAPHGRLPKPWPVPPGQRRAGPAGLTEGLSFTASPGRRDSEARYRDRDYYSSSSYRAASGPRARGPELGIVAATRIRSQCRPGIRVSLGKVPGSSLVYSSCIFYIYAKL